MEELHPTASALVRFEESLRDEVSYFRKDPASDARGNVVFAVAYLEQMTEHHPEVIDLVDRFKVVALKLPGNVRAELGQFTRMFADGKDEAAKLPSRER